MGLWLNEFIIMTNIKYKLFLNKIYYVIRNFGFTSEKKDVFYKEIYKLIFIGYVLWFIFTTAVQIIFLDPLFFDAAIFISILLFVIAIMFLGTQLYSEEVRSFIKNCPLQPEVKVKLFISNELSSSLFSWFIVLLLAVPLILFQSLKNGIVGLSYLSYYLFILLVISFIFFLFRYLHFLIFYLYNKNILNPIKVIFIILFFLLAPPVLSYVIHFIKSYYTKDNRLQFLSNFLRELNIKHYIAYFSPNISYTVIGIIIIIIVMCICILLTKRIHVYEKKLYMDYKKIALLKIDNKWFYVLNNYLRENNLIDNSLFITYFIFLIIYEFMEEISTNTYWSISVILLAFIMLPNYINSDYDNKLLFLKRNGVSLMQSTFFYSTYPLLQLLIWFSILYLLKILFLNSDAISTIMSGIMFFIFGSIMNISCILFYNAITYILERYIDVSLFKDLKRFFIAFILTLVIFVYHLFNVLLKENIFLSNIIISILLIAIAMLLNKLCKLN